MDATFRLCRRKKAGKVTLDEKPLFGDEVFINQALVDQYVCSSEALGSSNSEVSYSSHMQAWQGLSNVLASL